MFILYNIKLMPVHFDISTVLPAKPKEVYDAWLSSGKHGLMTGGKASIKPLTGSVFSVWDGYITGKNLELVPYKKIIQTWRTADFEEDDPDSLLEIQLEQKGDSCELRLIHLNIPDHQPDYEQGLKEHYFEPMKEYFNK
jgi:activator of HSP90 ATPase